MSTPIELPPTTIHYAITADNNPGALPLVIELFAQHNITPDLAKVRHYKMDSFHDGNLCIDIHVSDLTPSVQESLLQKLRVLDAVQNVREEILYQKTPVKLAS